MGVKISEIVPKKEIKVDMLANRILAVDALNAIYQFLSIIRQADGTPLKDSKGRITSHLSGLFYRNVNLLEKGLKLVYVFDGERPQFKEKTVEERQKMREEAAEKWRAALEAGELAEARKYAQAAISIDDEMIEESKSLLEAMGIAVVQAPSEGEAQAAHLVKKGNAYASVSQDMDSLLFGSPRLIRNLNITGKRKVPGRPYFKEISPELIELQELLSALGISQDELIIIGILVGTDYNPEGVKGIGPKKALKLVKDYHTLDRILMHVEWEHDVDPHAIFDFFKNPPVEDVEVNFPSMDREKIIKILVDEHEFSMERVENALSKLEEAEKAKSQKTLFSFG